MKHMKIMKGFAQPRNNVSRANVNAKARCGKGTELRQHSTTKYAKHTNARRCGAKRHVPSFAPVATPLHGVSAAAPAAWRCLEFRQAAWISPAAWTVPGRY
jgi:hypothetical protein